MDHIQPAPPRVRRGNRAIIAGRPVDFFADARGTWRTPIGSSAPLQQAERDRMRAVVLAGRRTAAALRSAANG